MSGLASCVKPVCGRNYIYFTGRGATAIYLALRAGGIRGKAVLLPSSLCPSPVNAVIYSGNRPLLCDVDPSTFVFDARHLERLLKRQDIGAAILVHLYGYPFPAEMARQLKKKNIFLIEDACQALGTMALQKNGASIADCTVLSFGHSKIIDVGDGGAVASDDKKFMGLLRRAGAVLRPKPSHHGKLAALYKRLYYSLTEAAAIDVRFHDALSYFPELFKDLYLYRYPKSISAALAEKLKFFKESLRRRRSLYEVYRGSLGPHGIHFPQLSADCPVWRATGLVHSGRQRDRVVEGLRAQKFEVSAWYPSLHRWYKNPEGKSHRDRDFPGSLNLEKRVINFWVDESVDKSKVIKTCEQVKRLLRR